LPRNGNKRAEPGWWKLPLLSGVLLGVSYWPGPFLALNVASLLPLLAWLERRPTRSAYERFKAGLVFGVASQLVALHFMYAMLDYSWLAVVLYLAMSLGVGTRMACAVTVTGWLRRRFGLSWSVALPIAWVAFEWLQSWGDLKMTGEHLAHTVAGYPFLIQFADLVGHYGVGAVVVVINALLYETIVGWRKTGGRRPAIVLALLLTAIVGYDAWRWTRAEPDGQTLRVAVIQPNVPIDVKHDPATAGDRWSTLNLLSVEAARQGAELIVWPESARPQPVYHWLDRPETYAMFDVQALARALGVAFLVGVEYAQVRDRQDFDLYNAAMAVDEQGKLLEDWGAKVYLVPFTEAIPFKRFLAPLIEGKGGEWRWLSGGFDRGPNMALLDVAGARVGVLVCYEQLFPDPARQLRNAGADLQVVITNDAWWGRSLFQQYQANALRLRAIENRTAFVRVANTGISGFVDDRGRYHQRTALFEEAVEDDRIGDLVAWLAVACLLAATIVGRFLVRTPRVADR